VCRVVPELTYEQALVASEVDVAFHIEDKESWRQSFSPSLPLSLFPPSSCPSVFVIYFTRALKGLKHVPTFLQCALKTIGLSCLPTEAGVPTELCMCVSNRCLVPVIDGSTAS
jgi:hypothetical protein